MELDFNNQDLTKRNESTKLVINFVNDLKEEHKNNKYILNIIPFPTYTPKFIEERDRYLRLNIEDRKLYNYIPEYAESVEPYVVNYKHEFIRYRDPSSLVDHELNSES